MAGSRHSHPGSQVGLVGSRRDPAWLFTWETQEFNIMPLSKIPKDKWQEGVSPTLKAEGRDWLTKIVKTAGKHKYSQVVQFSKLSWKAGTVISPCHTRQFSCNLSCNFVVTQVAGMMLHQATVEKNDAALRDPLPTLNRFHCSQQWRLQNYCVECLW